MQRANHPISTIAWFFVLLLVTLLLVQSALTGASAARAAATVATETTANSADTGVMTSTPSPVAQSGNPADDVEPGIEIAAPPETGEETGEEPPAVSLPIPLLLSLESDRVILIPGLTATLTIEAWRATEEEIAGQPLTLNLPPQLRVLTPLGLSNRHPCNGR